MPLLKAMKVDNDLLELLHNHLISTKAKHGQTIGVPLGAQVQELPNTQLCTKCTALVESWEDNYKEVACQLAKESALLAAMRRVWVEPATTRPTTSLIPLYMIHHAA